MATSLKSKKKLQFASISGLVEVIHLKMILSAQHCSLPDFFTRQESMLHSPGTKHYNLTCEHILIS